MSGSEDGTWTSIRNIVTIISSSLRVDRGFHNTLQSCLFPSGICIDTTDPESALVEVGVEVEVVFETTCCVLLLFVPLLLLLLSRVSRLTVILSRTLAVTVTLLLESVTLPATGITGRRVIGPCVRAQ